MTALALPPRSENPEKGESQGGTLAVSGYPPFSPFSEPGELVRVCPIAAALVAARAYRRTRPVAPGPKERARARQAPCHGANAALAVPAEWTAGVGLLAAMACPACIDPRRWGSFVLTAARLLYGHGPALHA